MGEDVTVGSRDEVRVAVTLAADSGNSISTHAAGTSYLLEARWFYLVLFRKPRRVTCCIVTYRQTSKFNICPVSFIVYLMPLYKVAK